MPHEFFDHKADIGIRGIGKTLEEAFEEAAKAMFEVMFTLKNVSRKLRADIHVNAKTLDELLVEWLNALLAEKDILNAVFAHFRINRMEQTREGWVLEGTAYGERLDPTKHMPEVEVKAATYSQLKVFRSQEREWVAQCVVDV